MRLSSVVGAVCKREIVPSVVRGRTLRRMSRLEWAAAHAAELLSELPGRWLHTEGVVGRARRVSEAMAEEEGEMLVAAAYLHDSGYAPTLAGRGFIRLMGLCICASGRGALGRARCVSLGGRSGSASARTCGSSRAV